MTRHDPTETATPEDVDDKVEGAGRIDLVQGIRDGDVPVWLRTAASISWRILVVGFVVIAVAFAVNRLRLLVVPLLLALLIAAVLTPPARWLRSHGFAPALATWVVFFSTLASIAGIGWLAAPRIAATASDVGSSVTESYYEVRDWVINGPPGLDRANVQNAEDRIVEQARSIAETGITSRATLLIEVATSFFLTLVISFFYVKDGVSFREKLLTWLPPDDRERARAAILDGWHVLQRYLLGVVAVGAVDSILIGIGLLIIGVPHVIPLMLLTFLAAFFPLVGAIAAGAMATLLTLASGGVVPALFVVGLSILVQQLDGHVVAPFVYSRAVNLHPLGILMALTAGSLIAGIIGAFLSIPVVAVTLAAVSTWRGGSAESATRARTRAGSLPHAEDGSPRLRDDHPSPSDPSNAMT